MKSVALHGFWILFLAMASLAEASYDSIRRCRETYLELEVLESFAEIYARAPFDPVARALALKIEVGGVAVPFELQQSTNVSVPNGRWGRKQVTTFDWLIPATVSGNHPSLRAYPDLDFQTVRYASPNDLWWHGEVTEIPGPPPRHFKKFKLRPHGGSQMVVNFTHGLTAPFSNSGRVFNQLKVMNGAKPLGTIQTSLTEQKLWFEATAVAADLPFHGPATSDPKLFSLAETLAWRENYYRSLKVGDLPLSVVARSGENLFLGQLAFEHPELFKAMVWMSPLHPTEGFKESIEGTTRNNREEKLPLNGAAWRWFTDTVEQMLNQPKEKQWWQTETGLPPVPVLILVGEHDIEVSQATREHYKKLARLHPDKIVYVEVPGASHDVYATTEYNGVRQESTTAAQARAIGAWSYTYWFLQNHVLGKNVPEPNLGWRHTDGIVLGREIQARLPKDNSFSEASQQFPSDPVRRGVALKAKHGEVTIPFQLYRGDTDWLVPHTSTGYHPSLRAMPNLDLNTVLYYGQNDLAWTGKYLELPGNPPLRFKEHRFRPHETAKVVVSWIHGLTGFISNAGRVFPQLKVMNSAKPLGAIQQALLTEKLWVESATVAGDMPFHGAGSSDLRYLKLSESLAWRESYYRTLGMPGLPVVAAARSGENLFLAQLAFEHPELFKGMIWMNPMHPTKGFYEAVAGYKKQNIDTGVPINPLAFQWFTENCEQMLNLPQDKRWWESPEGIPPVPVLILIGEKDIEVPEATRQHYRELARRNPDRVTYVEIPGAGHDVFSVTETYIGQGQRWTPEAEGRAIQAWKEVYRFLNRVL